MMFSIKKNIDAYVTKFISFRIYITKKLCEYVLAADLIFRLAVTLR